MPRRRAPPRLYLDPARRDWVIRDGASFIRTGFGEHDRERAEKRLAEYLGAKWEPERGPDPLIADVLNIYAREHLAHAATARNSSYSLTYLLRWWGTRHTSAVTPANCRAYAAAATSMATARKDLELLKAALRHYTRSTGIVLQTAVVLPRKAAPRTRWLTRSEAARLLWAARRLPHLSRFIRLALARARALACCSDSVGTRSISVVVYSTADHTANPRARRSAHRPSSSAAKSSATFAAGGSSTAQNGSSITTASQSNSSRIAGRP